MLRHLIVFLFCASLACCQKNSSSESTIEQSFPITKGNEDGLNAVKSLAFEAKAWETSKAHSKKQGWKAVGAVGEPVRPNTSFKNADEELAYYGSVIFRSLGYPLQDTPGSGFSLKTNREVVIRHRKEALEDFGLLLERWKRSREERWNDMLNGKK